MDKFQIFDRENNYWDNSFKLVAGWNENFVLDKTTDSATIKAKYIGDKAPKYKCGDWCRLLHTSYVDYEERDGFVFKQYIGDVSKFFKYKTQPRTDVTNTSRYIFKSDELFEENFALYYNNLDRQYNITWRDDYKGKAIASGWHTNSNMTLPLVDEWTQVPDNFFKNTSVCMVAKDKIYIPKYDQFILGNITYVKDEINGEWDCQLSLKEPIEITNGIVCETMSFTSQGNKIIDGITRTHEGLTHLSVLEKILKVTPANNNIKNSWFSRITIQDRDLLESLPFADETYSEPTLYNVLLDKYDSSVGRTPVLYFDLVDDLPRNREKASYLLNFMRQDGFDKEDINLNNLVENSTQYQENRSDSNSADGIVSNFDNLTTNNTIKAFAENLWLIPQVDTDKREVGEYGLSSDVGIWVLKTQYPIKKIISIERLIINEYASIVSTSPTPIYRIAKNIDKLNVYEEQEYKSTNGTIYNVRGNNAWFTQGTDTIHLNDYYYKDFKYYPSGNVEGQFVVYKVEYEPLISARYDLANDNQVQLNQTNSQIDNVKFGKYISEYAKSLNKADLIITKTVSDYYQIKEVGTRVVDGNKNYIITNVGVQNRGFDYDVVYQLNENHIRKSDNIVAPSEIRKNLAIDVKGFKERKSMLTQKYELKVVNNPFEYFENLINNGILRLNNGVLSKGINTTSISGELYLPNSVTEIDEYCFENCENLIKIVCSNALTRIRSYAFSNCGLKEIDLSNCNNLVITDNIASGDDVGIFESCTNLEFVNLPNSVETISRSMFDRCENLQTLYISSGINNVRTEYDAQYGVQYWNLPFFKCNRNLVIYCEANQVSFDSYWNYTTDEDNNLVELSVKYGYTKKQYLNEIGKESQDIPRLLTTALTTTEDNVLECPQLAYLTIPIKYFENTEEFNKEIDYKYMLAELSRYSLNNTLCFNVKYQDNAQAGTRKQLQQQDIFFASPQYQIPVLYTNGFGEIKDFNFKMISFDTNVPEQDFEKQLKNIAIPASSYPEANETFRTNNKKEIDNPVIEIDNIQYHKDMLDQMNYTIGLNVVSKGEIIISDDLLNNSILSTINGNKIAHIQTFNNNITLQDYNYIEHPRSIDVISSKYVDGKIIIKTNGNMKVNKSIVLVTGQPDVTKDRVPLLIINDFDKLVNTETINTIVLSCEKI